MGAQIKQWRVNMGMTMAECARVAGMAASQWGRVEADLVHDPNMRTVIKMFQALGAQIEVKMEAKEPKWFTPNRASE